MLKRASRADTAAHLDDWMDSLGTTDGRVKIASVEQLCCSDVACWLTNGPTLPQPSLIWPAHEFVRLTTESDLIPSKKRPRRKSGIPAPGPLYPLAFLGCPDPKGGAVYPTCASGAPKFRQRHRLARIDYAADRWMLPVLHLDPVLVRPLCMVDRDAC